MKEKTDLVINIKLLEKAVSLVKDEIRDTSPEKIDGFFTEQEIFYRDLKQKHLQESQKRYSLTDAVADIYEILSKINC